MSFMNSLLGRVSGGTVHNSGAGAAPVASATSAPAATETPPVVQQPQPQTSPLDKFAKLWDTPTDADGKPIAPTADPLTQPVFQFDPVKIQESVKNLDFTAGIAPEDVQKALSGDAASFAAVINKAVSNAVVGMTVNQGNLINKAMTQNNANLMGALPDKFKQVQLQSAVPENPALQHPAMLPFVQLLRAQHQKLDPRASVAEIEARVTEQFNSMADVITGTRPPSAEAVAAAKESAGTDFSSWRV